MNKWIKPTAWVNSEQADEVAEFYSAGHSVRETAEMFGVTTAQVNNLVKKRQITNGRDPRKVANDKRTAEAEQRLVELLKTKGFDYIGGYIKKDCKVNIRCQRCGAVFERATDTIKHGNIICKECQKVETRKRQEQREQERRLNAEQRQKEQEKAREQKERQIQLERGQKLDEVYVCKVCGKGYTPRQYMESAGLTLFSNVGYCSHECKRKAENRLRKTYKRSKDTHRHRARKYGCEYDPTVTLERLIERDGLRCAICGEMCDPNDTRWSKFSGPLSPSMDHIIPMAKGGGHTWDNVQVAHIICNSYKGDSVTWKSSNLILTR